MEYMAVRAEPNKPLITPIPRNYGLFCGLFRAPHALCKRGCEVCNGADRFGGRPSHGIEAAAECIDQRGADHGAVGVFSYRPCRLRRADAEADADWQFSVTLD